MEQRYKMDAGEEAILEKELNQLLKITLQLECELEAVISKN